MENCWRSKNEFISDALLCMGMPVLQDQHVFIYNCSLWRNCRERWIIGMTSERERERERVREIRVNSTFWRWWWHTYIRWSAEKFIDWPKYSHGMCQNVVQIWSNGNRKYEIDGQKVVNSRYDVVIWTYQSINISGRPQASYSYTHTYTHTHITRPQTPILTCIRSIAPKYVHLEREKLIVLHFKNKTKKIKSF